MFTNNYVLDTSALLSTGGKIFSSLDDTHIMLTTEVLKELQEMQGHPTHGKSAYSVLRELGRIRSEGNIWDGVDLEGNSRVSLSNPTVNTAFMANDYKKSLLSVLSLYMNTVQKNPHGTLLISSDLETRLLGDLHSVKTKSLVIEDENQAFIDSVQTFEISDEAFEELQDENTVRLDLDVPINVGVVLRAGAKSALAIAKPEYRFTRIPDMKVSNMEAKTKEQHIAMKQLKDDTIKAVSLGGIAGGGKTAMALAAGVEALEKNQYKKIVVFRSMQAVGGEELGFLPGDEKEKLDPWTAAIYDALEPIVTPTQLKKLKSDRALEVLPITHVRGRTLSKSFIIVDEAQNLSLDTIKTLLTRVSHSSKMVLTHDITQRDNFRVGKLDGIHEVVARLHGDKLFAHTALIKSERSELAQTVARLLD